VMVEKALALQELTTVAVSNLQLANWLVVWPIASLEQHGPHLPLGTDAIVLDGVVDGVRERLGTGFPALFLPPMYLPSTWGSPVPFR